jgi:glutamine synthetase adenylyltransferase
VDVSRLRDHGTHASPQCKRDKVSAENEAARLQAELNRERTVGSEVQAISRRDADTLRTRLNDALAESRRLQDQITRDEAESRRLEQRLEDERSTHDNSRRVLQRQLAQAEEGKAAAERQLEAAQADLRLARTKTDKLEADIKEKEVRDPSIFWAAVAVGSGGCDVGIFVCSLSTRFPGAPICTRR